MWEYAVVLSIWTFSWLQGVIYSKRAAGGMMPDKAGSKLDISLDIS